ncbi:GNAT family N-acetyltransferase [Endozoicomonas sp. ONNA2]|uniref:GNAT family N-acetyltransferase n=1 Tax=Endozoicomonas sp. ONNA2 TaxID=2828741 RepID=UPI002149646C|nr:GNAT family N-acetyltransferase [Endozoicomonas sp. ONNA2]
MNMKLDDKLNDFRLVHPDNETEVDLWHRYEEKICDDNFGRTRDKRWFEGYEDEVSSQIMLEGHQDHMAYYTKEYWRYFILSGSEIAGTFAVKKETAGMRFALVECLYVLPECRRQGLSNKALNAVYQQACRSGLEGIRLETEYPWKPAINYYLHNRYWLLHWNPSLNFICSNRLPQYSVYQDGEWLSMALKHNSDFTPLLYAKNNGDSLEWVVHDSAQEVTEDLLITAETTFSLHLDVMGWPLKRSGKHQRSEGGCGGPEALAAQIECWNRTMSRTTKKTA